MQRSLRSSQGFFEPKGYNKTGKGEGRAAFQAKVDGVVTQVVGGVQAFTDPLSSLARTHARKPCRECAGWGERDCSQH